MKTLFFAFALLSVPAVAQDQVLRADCTITAPFNLDKGELPRTIAEIKVEIPHGGQGGERREIYRDRKGTYALVYGDSMHVIDENGNATFDQEIILSYKKANGDKILNAITFVEAPVSISLSPGERSPSIACSIAR